MVITRMTAIGVLVTATTIVIGRLALAKGIAELRIAPVTRALQTQSQKIQTRLLARKPSV